MDLHEYSDFWREFRFLLYIPSLPPSPKLSIAGSLGLTSQRAADCHLQARHSIPYLSPEWRFVALAQINRDLWRDQETHAAMSLSSMNTSRWFAASRS